MHKDIIAYNQALPADRRAICELLANEIQKALADVAESKVWHRSPVWFIQGNPVAGYASLKDSVQLLFWSGQSFDEPDLQPEGTFKAAQKRYTAPDQIDTVALARWLQKAQDIQWDYKNIVKNKGRLDRLR